MTVELSLFLTALRKELWQQWRTRRLLIVGTVFLLFGLLSPLIARFTPELLRSFEETSAIAELLPEPTQADALLQYIKNLSQFGFILAIVLGMGAVAGEKEKGTVAMILSKPLPRWAFILSKFSAQILVYVLALLLAGLAAYTYTSILFSPPDATRFLQLNLLLLLWLSVFAAVTLLASTLAISSGGAAGIALAGAVLLLLAGAIPPVAGLAPAELTAWAGRLAIGENAAASGEVLGSSLILILGALVAAVAIFQRQEL